jgi:hypothetical protein
LLRRLTALLALAAIFCALNYFGSAGAAVIGGDEEIVRTIDGPQGPIVVTDTPPAPLTETAPPPSETATAGTTGAPTQAGGGQTAGGETAGGEEAGGQGAETGASATSGGGFPWVTVGVLVLAAGGLGGFLFWRSRQD